MSHQDQDQPRSERLCAGKIATAHGVKGLVKILVYADDPYLLDGSVYTDETGTATLELSMKNSMGKYWLASVKSVSDRTDAENLRGIKLWIEKKVLPEADQKQDEFYVHDLVGLKACDAEGRHIAYISSVENYGAGDLLELTLLDGESLLVPFTKDNIPAIDIPAGHVTLGDINAYLSLANK